MKHINSYMSYMDEYSLNEALSVYKPKIAELCGISAASIALEIIRSIIKEDKNQFSYYSIITIENHPQNINTEEFEHQLVYFVRDMFEKSNPIKIKLIIQNLFNEDHSIFKRIALHIIDYHYNVLNEIFWSLDENPLDNSQLKHELYTLFKNNSNNFTEQQIDKVINWIESSNYYIPKDILNDKKKVDILLAYSKREWLSSLLDINNQNVISLNNKYSKINSYELNHPGFNFWSESGWVEYKSPIKKEDLLSKSNEDIANYLNNYNNIEDWGTNSLDGLLETFRAYIVDDPNKFLINLKPFLHIKRIYQCELLSGFLESWNKKMDFSWDNLFDYIFEIVNSDTFWSDEYKENKENYRIRHYN